MLVVADGVGGWIELGIDSGKYSRELCKQYYFKSNSDYKNNDSIGELWNKNTNLYRKKPKNLIIDSAKLTKSEGSR